MAKKSKNKRQELRMQDPERYDATASKVVAVPENFLARAFDRSFRQGLDVGSLVGAGGVALTSVAVLVTSESFNSFLSIDGSTWEAIFTLLLIGSVVYLLVRAGSLYQKKENGGFGPEAITSKFFKDEFKR